MDHRAGFLSYPFELLHIIGKFLTIKDVLSSSKACHHLRTAFNDNRIWKKFSRDDVVELESTDQMVQPVFQWDETLSPLCESRMHYIKLNRVLKNLQTSNYITHRSETVSSTDTHHLNSKATEPVFYNNRYVFLQRIISNYANGTSAIEIWDLSKGAQLHTFIAIENMIFFGFRIAGSKLVVYECRKVWVYQINLPEKHIPLLYSYTITEAEANCKGGEIGSPRNMNNSSWYCSSHVIGQYVVSNGCYSNILHVWDLNSATKVGAFTVPLDSYSVRVVAYGKNELLLRGKDESEVFKCFLFDLTTQTFSNTGYTYDYLDCENKQPIVNLVQSHIVIVCSRNVGPRNRSHAICTVYDLERSVVVKRRCIYTGSKELVVLETNGGKTMINGSFVLLADDGFHQIDALTLKTLNYFECETHHSQCTGHRLTPMWNIVLGSTLVLARDKYTHLCVFNVTKKEKYHLNVNKYCDFFIANETMSTLVLSRAYELEVLNYW